MAKQKLTREQIQEGLDQIPMESLLRGASGTEVNLTAKQIEFAKQLALGKTTKADAYRKAYNSKGKPKTVGSHAHKLSTDDRIRTAVEAFRTAEQYREYQTPAQLRALVVSQLTYHVLDPDFPPAQRVQCLKLLGSVAEIGLFVDRKETLVVHQSADIRERLLSQLKNVIDTQATDVTPNDDADSLLDEINSAKSVTDAQVFSDAYAQDAKEADGDPTGVAPPAEPCMVPADDIHSIPHEVPLEKSIPQDSPFHKFKPRDEYPHGGEPKQSLDNK